jgi:iron complex transport system substrate-binding protein
LALAACAAMLAGCASGSTTRSAPAPRSATPTAAHATIDNCGTRVPVGTEPKRIITLKSTSTELLLALGLAPRMIGAAFLDGPIPKNLTAHGSPRILSEGLPDEESVLSLKPDFLYADWESNFSTSGVGTRDALAKLGIGTYVSPSACQEKAYMPDPLAFDTVFTEINQAGRIFGAQSAARTLVARQRAQLAALKPLTRPVRALWYSSASTTPYVGAGIGAPQMIMRAAGLTNIFADVHNTWTPVSWESVAKANPQVIVLADSSWSTAAKKIGIMESNPVTKNLDAVRHHRYVVLPFAATEAGVRNVDAVSSTLAQLRKLGYT